MNIYMGSAIGLLILGVGFIWSIGIYPLFVAIAMFSAAPTLKSRPWVAAGTVSGALSAVLVHVFTAPLTCSTTATAGALGSSQVERCSRILLPDVVGLDTTGATILALALAAAGGVLAGVLVARAVREALAEPA
jgi:hypothetical protein